MTQTCINCKEEKEIKDYDKCYTRVDGTIVYRKKCKKCRWEIKKSKKSDKKKCKTCKNIFDLSNFYIYQKRLKDITYRSDCKKCYDNNRLKKQQEIKEKKCTKCNTIKSIKDFDVNTRKDNNIVIFRSECKKCRWGIEKARRDRKRTEPKQNYNGAKGGMKICSQCCVNKSLDNYRYIRNRNTFRSNCHDCEKKYKKIYRENPLVKERRQKYNKTVKEKYRSYEKTAKRRNLNFELSIDEFENLTRNKKCYLCNDFHKIIGIDRINNNVGYEKSNCLSCCQKCNQAKMQLGLNDFYKHIEKIYKNKNINYIYD